MVLQDVENGIDILTKLSVITIPFFVRKLIPVGETLANHLQELLALLRELRNDKII